MITNADEKKLMSKYDIQSDLKKVYHYKKYRYDNLQQAVDFAVLDQKLVHVQE